MAFPCTSLLGSIYGQFFLPLMIFPQKNGLPKKYDSLGTLARQGKTKVFNVFWSVYWWPYSFKMWRLCYLKQLSFKVDAVIRKYRPVREGLSSLFESPQWHMWLQHQRGGRFHNQGRERTCAVLFISRPTSHFAHKWQYSRECPVCSGKKYKGERILWCYPSSKAPLVWPCAWYSPRLHGVLRGVTKQLLNLWLSPSRYKKPWFRGNKTKAIDKRLKNMKPPDFIQRLPRKLETSRAYFKASELQAWLL